MREPCHSNAHEGGGDTSWLNHNVFWGEKEIRRKEKKGAQNLFLKNQ